MKGNGSPIDEATIEEIAFLARSRTRARALGTLWESGSLTKSELRDRLDASRTTVSRNVDALRDRGLVANRNGTYTITRADETIAADFSDLVTTTEIAARLEPLLEWVPDAEFDVDLDRLVDATVITADESNPYAPVNRHVEALKRADHVRLFVGVTGQHAWEIAERRVVTEEATHKYVIGSGVAETLRTDRNYGGPCEAMLATDRFDLTVYDGEVPYYLGLLDDVVQIGAEDDEGMPRALVEADIDALGEWATDMYDRYRDRSTPFSMEAAP
jgi:predicted transcriptional regulator